MGAWLWVLYFVVPLCMFRHVAGAFAYQALSLDQDRINRYNDYQRRHYPSIYREFTKLVPDTLKIPHYGWGLGGALMFVAVWPVAIPAYIVAKRPAILFKEPRQALETRIAELEKELLDA